MRRKLTLTISVGFALETNSGSRFEFISKLFIPPSRTQINWQRLLYGLLPAPFFAG
jgi:hypothetical protein